MGRLGFRDFRLAHSYVAHQVAVMPDACGPPRGIGRDDKAADKLADLSRRSLEGRSVRFKAGVDIAGFKACLADADFPVRRLGHNDLLAANIIDDGERLWLIDWEYAGFNSALFDLGGLASNSEMPEALREGLLEAYFERPVTDDLRRRFAAMTAASLMRETLWSMVSESHSKLDFDYAAYTAENLARFEAAYAAFVAMEQ